MTLLFRYPVELFCSQHTTPNQHQNDSSYNPLPHMPIFGSSNSAANKDMMSKMLKSGDTIF